mmetsp:Transcript_14618/g.39121  ORF Transcript_14618/g.39121 Transcript_14618/m.39121 type:complete len:289 (-) Transcript_14618:73-939(-)
MDIHGKLVLACVVELDELVVREPKLVHVHHRIIVLPLPRGRVGCPVVDQSYLDLGDASRDHGLLLSPVGLLAIHAHVPREQPVHDLLLLLAVLDDLPVGLTENLPLLRAGPRSEPQVLVLREELLAHIRHHHCLARLEAVLVVLEPVGPVRNGIPGHAGSRAGAEVQVDGELVANRDPVRELLDVVVVLVEVAEGRVQLGIEELAHVAGVPQDQQGHHLGGPADQGHLLAPRLLRVLRAPRRRRGGRRHVPALCRLGLHRARDAVPRRRPVPLLGAARHGAHPTPLRP